MANHLWSALAGVIGLAAPSVAFAASPNGIYLQTGYRAGLSDDAPNHLIKFFIGQKF